MRRLSGRRLIRRCASRSRRRTWTRPWHWRWPTPAYTAARKACAALLAVQGLRSTSDGGHLAVEHAVRAQFGGPGSSFSRYGWLRRHRNDSEYPDADTPPMSPQHADDAIQAAADIVNDAKKLLGSDALDTF